MTMTENLTQPTSSVLSSPKQWIERRVRRFFAKRVPCQDKLTLSIRNVYIIFSREGILFALLLLITFITGINYGNNLVLGLCFYLSSILLVSMYITFLHISGLKIRLLDVTLAEAGKPAWASIQVTNLSSQPSRQLSFRFDHSDYLSRLKLTQDTDISKQALRQKTSQYIPCLDTSQTIRLPIMTDKRGRLQLPRLVIRTTYPLGIMQAWAYAYFATPAWVYPQATAFDWNASHALASDDETNYSQFQTQGQNDFDRLDEYQQGESLSRVSWGHLARGHGMLTKHFADNVGHELTLDYADMPASHHEQKLKQLAFAIQKLAKEEQAFILNLPNDIGQLGQGQAFINDSLLRLAKTP